jgi:hypothetical protein
MTAVDGWRQVRLSWMFARRGRQSPCIVPRGTWLHKELRWVTAAAAVVLLGSVISVEGAATAQEVHARAGSLPEIAPTDAQLSELGKIANALPCTFSTLIQFLGSNSRAAEGNVFIDWPPSPEMIEFMLDSLHESNHFRGAAELPQLNPYSVDPYLVQGHWRVQSAADGAVLVYIRVELVDRAGAPLVPPHLAEPPAVVAVNPEEIKLMTTTMTGIF